MVALALILCAAISQDIAAVERPNIVLIVYDDLNTDATHEPSSPFITPYLDKLAAESLSFSNAVANVPACTPSRDSFFSGLLPTTIGAYLNGSNAWREPGSGLKHVASLPRHFKENGYLTWGAGKIFHSPMPDVRLRIIFDTHVQFEGNSFGPFADDKYAYIHKAKNPFFDIQAWPGADLDFPDVRNADEAIRFLAQEHDKPFFMVYGLWRPHAPYVSPKRFFDLYQDVEFAPPKAYLENDLDDLPATARQYSDQLQLFREADDTINFDRWRKFLWGYAAGVSFADWNMGRVIEALDQSEYAENTLVVVISDNGYHLGDKDRWGKFTLWESAAAVPFFVRGKGVSKGTSTIPMSLVDIYPTLVDYAGIPQPAHTLDGNSLLPWFESPGKEMLEPSFVAYDKHNASIEDERYRYIRYMDGSEEFYDHQLDPYEHHNLASDPTSRQRMDELAKQIPKTWAPSTGGKRRTADGKSVWIPSEHTEQANQDASGTGTGKSPWRQR